MTQTENFNRIVAMEAGRLHFAEALGQLRGEGGMFGGWGKGRTKDLLEEMWRLNKEEIQWLETADLSKPENAAKLENIMGIVEHYAHISTQGGTSVGQLPLWASSNTAKPFTLFQRMAYSTTWDSYRNYWMPMVKHRNFAPIMKATVGHTLSGAALYGMYDALFHTEMPASGKGGMDRALTYMWRSEMLGVYGEILSPYNKGQGVALMEPVILRNANEARKEMTQWWYGGKTFKQASKDWLRNTVVVYGQIDRYAQVRDSKFFSDSKRINTWTRQYQDSKSINPPLIESIARRKPYYRHLKEAMLSGNETEITKTFFAAYNYLIHDRSIAMPGSTPQSIHKEAVRAIMSSINQMNPLNISHESKGRIFSKKDAYLKWLLDNVGEHAVKTATDSEANFQVMKRKLIKFANDKNNQLKYDAFSGYKFYQAPKGTVFVPFK